MLEFAVLFRTLRVLAVFAGGATVAFALFVWLWPRLGSRWRAAAVATLGGAHLAWLIDWASRVQIDADEVLHLHAAWLMSRGLVPYRDFWQDHSPGLWLVIAPVAGLFHSSALLLVSRAFAVATFLLLVAGAGWLAWLCCRDRRAAVLAGLAVLMFGVRYESGWLRPDHLANLLVLASFALLAGAGGARAAGLAPFLSGACYGLALAFTPKPIFAAAAFPLAAALFGRIEPSTRLRQVLGYALGLIAGIGPLLVLLTAWGVAGDWFFWLFGFHVGDVQQGQLFPASLTLLGLAGCGWMWIAAHDRQTAGAALPPGRVVVGLAFLLQTAGLVITPTRTPASFALWAGLAAVTGAGPLAEMLRRGDRSPAAGSPEDNRPSPRRWLALAALALILMEVDALAPLVTRALRSNFAADRARLDWMVRQAAGRPVVLIAPIHPIVLPDATQLWELHQYSRWLEEPAVAAPLRGFASQLMNARPALIAIAPHIVVSPLPPVRLTLLETLLAARIVTPREAEALGDFIASHYRIEEFNGEGFYVWDR